MISGRPNFETRHGIPEINRHDIMGVMGTISDMPGVCSMVHMRIGSSREIKDIRSPQGNLNE